MAAHLNIVVVEDNNDLRTLLCNALRKEGHHVTALSCAEELEDQSGSDHADAFLIDINLPGEDGFSLVERIRKSQPHAGIVLMTARGQLSDRLEGYQSGADNYLIKPVEQAELLVCITNLARRIKASTPKPLEGLTLELQTLRLAGPKGAATLSHGESLLLAAFCRAAGHKLERWQAMQLVDAQDKGLLPANLEMRISALRKKLAACGAPDDAIRTIRGVGYALGIQVTLV